MHVTQQSPFKAHSYHFCSGIAFIWHLFLFTSFDSDTTFSFVYLLENLLSNEYFNLIKYMETILKTYAKFYIGNTYASISTMAFPLQFYHAFR